MKDIQWQPKPTGEPRELWLTSYHYFREVIGSTKYALREKDIAFDAFLTDSIRCKLLPSDEVVFQAMVIEWERRRVYEVLKSVKIGGKGEK